MKRSWHPAIWVIWLVCCSALVWRTRNGLYLVLLALCIALVRASLRRNEHPGDPRITLPIGRIALFMVPSSALLNAAWTRAGDSVLFRLPASIPLLGGPVTLEALVYGALNGAVLVILLSGFAAFNSALSARDQIGFVPRGFDALAVTGSIAIAYVPTTLRHARAIRDAQAVRGADLNGWRAWLPMFIPLLIGGLERAFDLAEALGARGFAATPEPSRAAVAQAAFVAGLAALALAWLAPVLGIDARITTSVVVLALCLIAGAFVLIARSPRSRRSAYRVTAFRPLDVICALALIAGSAWVLLSNDASLFYDPYRALSWPTFAPHIGAALVITALPALASVR
jgi:energy-coupling factor transport system permease protein